ncbi:nucleic acid-binding protein [Phaffia rhodozyma]|uniref:Nucleic acid-binding protein n=1 Tax=Phaffia rhodozyma TaxID=264483 RepID=A0A0F7SIR2_PHARH|nr:nucleic acid-binding protein [Phaffia rhodozyma]
MSTTINVSEIVTQAIQVLPSPSKDQDKVDQWVATAKQGEIKDLDELNKKLTPLTYLFNQELTTADVATYASLHPTYSVLPASEHFARPALTRYLLHIQSHPAVAPLLANFAPITVDVNALPPLERKSAATKEKKPKKPTEEAKAVATNAAPAAKGAVEGITDKLAGLKVQAEGALGSVAGAVGSLAESVVGSVVGAKNAVVGQAGDAAQAVEGQVKKEKKEKKEKKPKAPVVAAEPTGPMPSMIDLRVGHILSVEKHPDADSLYVEKVDVGEAEPRTIVSGLVNYMTIDEVKDKRIVVVANMKPVAMRGIKSFAMVLCATSSDGKDGGIEFVQPPPASKPGDRIYFEGAKYENETPLDVLNPKKKVFEAIQPGFTTLSTLEAAWVDPSTKEAHRIRTADGFCRVAKFVGASLS